MQFHSRIQQQIKFLMLKLVNYFSEYSRYFTKKMFAFKHKKYRAYTEI